MQSETYRRKLNKKKSNAPVKPYTTLKKKGQQAFRPAFQSTRELIYTLRKMYGLPLQTHTTLLPWGYDRLVEVQQFNPELNDTVAIRLAIPNDEALKILVQGKYLLQQSSIAKVGKWLTQSFELINYDFSYAKSYNPETGISVASVDRLYKLYTPDDTCVLPLYERQRAYQLRLQSTDCDIGLIEGARYIPSNIS